MTACMPLINEYNEHVCLPIGIVVYQPSSITLPKTVA